MALESIIILAVIGLVAGFLAGLIMRGGGFGVIGNIIVGILGAFIASFLFPRLGVAISTGTPLVDAIVVATIGAVILLFIIGLIRR